MATVKHEVVFTVPPSVVYEALTDASLFAQWTDAAAEIDATPGGAFAVFGPFIHGRNLDLVEGVRVVQAWRASNWDDGIFSIARFDLSADGTGTRLNFEQHGVPEEVREHIHEGWTNKYWEPMRAYFANRSNA